MWTWAAAPGGTTGRRWDISDGDSVFDIVTVPNGIGVYVEIFVSFEFHSLFSLINYWLDNCLYFLFPLKHLNAFIFDFFVLFVLCYCSCYCYCLEITCGLLV